MVIDDAFNTFMVDLHCFDCSMDASVDCVELYASEAEACQVDWTEVRNDHEDYLG
jgi:hypothetical protein